MGEDQEQRDDPMAMVDMSLTFTAPLISVRQSLLGSGMGEEQVEHITTDFAHFMLTSMTAQVLHNLEQPH